MLFLREANDGDIPLVLAWRNNPLVWDGTYTQRQPITYEEHKKWWDDRQDCKSFMVCLLENGVQREIGVCHISPLHYWSPEIGLIIGEVSAWNRGYGTEASRQACDFLKKQGYRWTSTTVLDTNLRAINVLLKLNYKRTCMAREGESRYAKELQ